jgi:hypothetical protein
MWECLRRPSKVCLAVTGVVGVTGRREGSAFLLDTCADEAEMNLVYDEHDLSPHFACDAICKNEEYDGIRRVGFEYEGERWSARLRPQESGLAPRDHPDYTNDTVREHRINVEPLDDPAGKRSANFHIAPRWPNPETVDPDAPAPSWPDDLLGVNVAVKGAKLPLDAYPDLLCRAAEALDINPDYFGYEHEYSNITTFETYVRARRELTGRVYGNGSPMQGIHELAGRTGKYRKLIEDDRGEEGSMHLTAFTPETAGALIDGHTLAKRPKHYLLRNPPEDPDDPLHHPKICMLFKKSLHGESVGWSERHDLRRELDETLLNLLSWSGLATRPDGETYVADGYFIPTDSAQPGIAIIEDPTPEIRREQEAAVMAALGGTGVGNPDLNQSDADTMELIADGGRDVGEIARLIGTSRRTVYRVVERLSELLSLDGGTVAFGSDHLAEKARLGLEATTDAFELDGGATAEPGPLAKWLNCYGPRMDELPGGLVDFQFGKVPDEWDIRAILRAGLKAWVDSGRERRRFVYGEAHWVQGGEACQEGGSYGEMDLPLLSSPQVRALD